MKAFLGAAALIGASLAISNASAADAPALSLSGNVALTTDYEFRGLSQTEHDPAIQGGFDLTYGMFYLGTWGSNLNFGSFGAAQIHVPIEVDVYAGIRPVFGPVSLDLGVVTYNYPGASDSGLAAGTWNYQELKVAGSIVPFKNATAGVQFFWSPEFPGKGGDAEYVEGDLGYTVSDKLAFSAAVGHQEVEAANYWTLADGSTTTSYTAWNIGGTYTIKGFGLDLRYFDADKDILSFGGNKISDEKVVFTIKRAL